MEWQHLGDFFSEWKLLMWLLSAVNTESFLSVTIFISWLFFLIYIWGGVSYCLVCSLEGQGRIRAQSFNISCAGMAVHLFSQAWLELTPPLLITYVWSLLCLPVCLAPLPPVMVPLSAWASSPGDLLVLESLHRIEDERRDFCHWFLLI